MGGIITHSGRIVSFDVDMGAEVTPPSLHDIGHALSRIPRFAGHTRRWWTVAHHVLWLDDYAKYNDAIDDIRLGILLHDAHEVVFGDIPSPFKTADMRSDQRQLDRAIFRRYHPRFWQIEEAVKHYDRIGLLAEADIVGPPALNYLNASNDEERDRATALYLVHFPGVPNPDASQYLYGWIDGRSESGGMAGLAAEFVDRVVRLL